MQKGINRDREGGGAEYVKICACKYVICLPRNAKDFTGTRSEMPVHSQTVHSLLIYAREMKS